MVAALGVHHCHHGVRRIGQDATCRSHLGGAGGVAEGAFTSPPPRCRTRSPGWPLGVNPHKVIGGWGGWRFDGSARSNTCADICSQCLAAYAPVHRERQTVTGSSLADPHRHTVGGGSLWQALAHPSSRGVAAGQLFMNHTHPTTHRRSPVSPELQGSSRPFHRMMREEVPGSVP